MRIYRENDDIIFDNNNKYILTSHPYEPCLYINEDGEIIKTVHNAFEVQDLPERFADNGKIFGADGRHYNEESFCKALEAALEYDKKECNFTYAAELSRMEKKCPSDFIDDGVLEYGVTVGRFIFDDENITVYAVSDLPHIGPSDVLTLYQISPADYKRLLKLSSPDRIPDKPVSKSIISSCRRGFLCGESIYQQRYYFRLCNVDKALTVKNKPKYDVYKFCPNCGRKSNGDKFCRDCGTNLIKTRKFRIVRITGTTCKCKFHLDDGTVIEADSEFKSGRLGGYSGQYVYKDNMRYSPSGIKLTESEKDELIKAYQQYADSSESVFEIDFFQDTEPKLIEKGDYMGVHGYIYEYADGTIVAATMCSECKIADSLAEFNAIPRDKLELMIYSNEMDVAR